MKLLVVGITYLSRINWDKYITMARLYPDSEFRVVFPERSKDNFGKELIGQAADFGNLKFIPLPAYLAQYETGHIYGNEFKKLIQEFRPDVILVEHGAFANSLAQAIWYKKKFSPTTKVIFFTWWNMPYKLPFPRNVIEKYNFQNTVGAITGNMDAKEILISRGYCNPIEVIPLLGADENTYMRRSQPELREKYLEKEQVGLLYAGRIVEQKGILTLLRAIKRLKKLELRTKWKLLLLGDGKLKPVVENFIRENRLEAVVTLLPAVDHYEVIKYMCISDIFILPSETMPYWKEQFGHVLVEAMACENVVVGSSSAEIPNVIGDAGFIFPEKNDEALASILARLVEHDQLRKEFAQKGRKRFLEHFTHTEIAKKTFEACRKFSSLREKDIIATT
jgi:glycosyltransferase involved in cell wall biosynthesis